jgi:hypothetical protein
MTIFNRAATFLVCVALGVGSTFLLPARTSSQLQCPRFYVRPGENFFTLDEGRKLLGRRVHWARPSNFPNNTGRVASLDMVESDKFYVVVDWDVSPDKGEHRLAWFNRDDYETILVEE